MVRMGRANSTLGWEEDEMDSGGRKKGRGRKGGEEGEKVRVETGKYGEMRVARLAQSRSIGSAHDICPRKL